MTENEKFIVARLRSRSHKLLTGQVEFVNNLHTHYQDKDLTQPQREALFRMNARVR